MTEEEKRYLEEMVKEQETLRKNREVVLADPENDMMIFKTKDAEGNVLYTGHLRLFDDIRHGRQTMSKVQIRSNDLEKVKTDIEKIRAQDNERWEKRGGMVK